MRKIIMTGMFWCAIAAPVQRVTAQIPVAEIIKAAVVKVIKAVDLQVQRLQNETMWLQNAQKTLENEMSKLKLKEISDWADHQKELYAKYFEELSSVKNAISSYQAVKDILSNQRQLVKEYSRAISLAKQDKNFTSAEIDFMQQVYTGIIGESLKNLDQLQLVVTALKTQMTDGKRLKEIHAVADNVESNLADLRQFNQQNILVSLQRSREKNDIDVVKKLYGLGE